MFPPGSVELHGELNFDMSAILLKEVFLLFLFLLGWRGREDLLVKISMPSHENRAPMNTDKIPER